MLPREGADGVTDWSRIKLIISGGRTFAVTSHTYPDGDAIGSTIAFLRLLRKMGKNARALTPSGVPPAYRFLDRRGELSFYKKEHDRFLMRADALFILDSSTNDRLGPLYHAAKRLGVRRVCIDHHPANTVDAEVKVVNTTACSTAQLVYELYRAFSQEIGKDTAEALYTGIHTDTVSFNFLGTDARTHEITADLLRRGVDPKETWVRIYGNDSSGMLRLAGVTLSRLRTADAGRVAWLTIAERDWRRHGVRPRDTESFTRYPLTIKSVGAIAVFCEERRDRIRVSMRALDNTDVSAIARSFGGGGHRTSAGAIVHGPLGRVVRDVLSRIKRRRRGGAGR
jgi:phosphoesterase RecJ-like protein